MTASAFVNTPNSINIRDGDSEVDSFISNSPRRSPQVSLTLAGTQAQGSTNCCGQGTQCSMTGQPRATPHFWSLMWNQHTPNQAWSKSREESRQGDVRCSKPADSGVALGRQTYLLSTAHTGHTGEGLWWLVRSRGNEKSACQEPKHNAQHFILKLPGLILKKVPSAPWHFTGRNTEAPRH